MNERAKLRWRCRRGMKELDLVLLAYLERRYDAATAEEQAVFRDLLDLQDDRLYAYLLGRDAPSEAAVSHVIHRLRTVLDA